jgi:hypothetical protein
MKCRNCRALDKPQWRFVASNKSLIESYLQRSLKHHRFPDARPSAGSQTFWRVLAHGRIQTGSPYNEICSDSVDARYAQKMKASAIALVVALCPAIAAMLWSLALLEWVLFPSGSGEWTALAVPASWFVNLPLGLIALITAIAAKQGSQRLRRLCTIASIVALTLPVLVTLFHNQRW